MLFKAPAGTSRRDDRPLHDPRRAKVQAPVHQLLTNGIPEAAKAARARLGEQPGAKRSAQTLGGQLGQRARPGTTTKRIEDIAVGDLVWAWDEAGGELVQQSVKKLFRHKDKPLVAVSLISDAGKQQLVEATTEHPFWVIGKGWIAASGLQPGDLLKRIDDGAAWRVVTAALSGKTADVFNFEVGHVHNYFVGREGVLAHNQSEASDNIRHASKMASTAQDAPKGTYYVPSSARPIQETLEIVRSGKKLTPYGTRSVVGERSSSESWIKGQLTETEYRQLQDLANRVGHAIGVAGSLAESNEGLGNRHIATVNSEVNEKMVGWRRRAKLPKFDDADVWHPEGLSSEQKQVLTEEVYKILGEREVDLAYGEHHKDLYDAPSHQGTKLGAGILVFQPASDIKFAPDLGEKPVVEQGTGLVPAFRVPGPWQRAGWSNMDLPALPSKYQYDTMSPYTPLGALQVTSAPSVALQAAPSVSSDRGPIAYAWDETLGKPTAEARHQQLEQLRAWRRAQDTSSGAAPTPMPASKPLQSARVVGTVAPHQGAGRIIQPASVSAAPIISGQRAAIGVATTAPPAHRAISSTEVHHAAMTSPTALPTFDVNVLGKFDPKSYYDRVNLDKTAAPRVVVVDFDGTLMLGDRFSDKAKEALNYIRETYNPFWALSTSRRQTQGREHIFRMLDANGLNFMRRSIDEESWATPIVNGKNRGFERGQEVSGLVYNLSQKYGPVVTTVLDDISRKGQRHPDQGFGSGKLLVGGSLDNYGLAVFADPNRGLNLTEHKSMLDYALGSANLRPGVWNSSVAGYGPFDGRQFW